MAPSGIREEEVCNAIYEVLSMNMCCCVYRGEISSLYLA